MDLKMLEAEGRLVDIEKMKCRKFDNALSFESKRFRSFLHARKATYVKVNPYTVKLFLSFRSIKPTSESKGWLSPSSLEAVRKRIEIYLKRKKYDPNPASHSSVLEFIKLYQKKVLSEGKSTKLTEPADPRTIDSALEYFASTDVPLANELHFIIAVAKQSGMRAGDILRLKGRDLSIKDTEIVIKPKEYKKSRGSKSWSVTIRKTGKFDCPFIFLPAAEDSENIFTIKSTSKLNKLIGSYKNQIGGCFTIHQIRVTVTLFLTAMGNSDSEILAFMNWDSIESLKRYRWGTDINELRGKTSLFAAWCLEADNNSKRLVSRWVSKLRS